MIHQKQADKVAIVGMAPSTRDQAPFKDTSFEIWACNEMYQFVPRITVLFEIHDREEYRAKKRNPHHLQWLRENKTIPVYTTLAVPDIPMSIPYPWMEIIAKYGTYLTSTVSLQLCLALHMEYREIHLYGVDMASEHEEYSLQRSSCEYFLGYIKGLFEGRGWPILYVPPESALLKSAFVYGRDSTEKFILAVRSLQKDFDVLKAEAEKNMLTYRDEMNIYKGAGMAVGKIKKMGL